MNAAVTFESEYVALAEGVNETCFLQHVMSFMMAPLDLGIKIHEDNEAAIRMVNNRCSSRRTRHIEVKHHIIQDTVDEGIVRVVCVQSGEQHADVLTKALDAKSFERIC